MPQSSGATSTPAPDRAKVGSQGLVGVQYLRAIAALMVAYYHVTIQIPALTPYFHRLLGISRLASGVDLFFIISGFIMSAYSRRSTPGDFLVRRIIRIVPLYWMLTLLLVVLHTVKPDVFHSVIVRSDFVLKSLLFIPYSPTGELNSMEPVLVAGWTLNFEMFFYLLFAVALFVPVRWRLALLGSAFALLIGMSRGLNLFGELPSLEFLANWRLLEFWSGMVLAEIYLTGALRLAPVASWSVILVCFVILLLGIPIVGPSLGDTNRFFLETVLPATATVAAVVALDSSGRMPHLPTLAYLGDASYSLYLSHPFSFGVARVVWSRLVGGSPSLGMAAAFGVFAMILCILGALVTFRYLEQPLLRGILNGYRLRRAASLSG